MVYETRIKQSARNAEHYKISAATKIGTDGLGGLTAAWPRPRQKAYKQRLTRPARPAPIVMNFSDALQGLSLTDVEPLDHKLGCGSYGKVFKIRHGGMVCAAKEIH